MATRILIIEDNATNMELMLYLLSAFGYATETATNGREGVEKAIADPPDIIICDLQMPGLNGYQVAQQLQGRIDLEKVPLIAVTAYAMVGDREKVLAAGFRGYIAKPIAPEHFIQQVESFLAPEKRGSRMPASSRATDTPQPAQRSNGATILVADDSPVNLDLVRSILEPSGYQVISTATVCEAMCLAREHSPALIVSDLHMPVESGYEFLRQVKADLALRSIPFVLYTASTTGEIEGERRRALDLGAKRFLTRPIEPEVLLSMIEAVLQETSGERHAGRTDR